MKYCQLFATFATVFTLCITIEARSAVNLTEVMMKRVYRNMESAILDEDIDEIEHNPIDSTNSSRGDSSLGRYRKSKSKPDPELCISMEIEADKSFKKLFMIGEDLIIPRNETELQIYCKHGKSAMKVATRYGKCLKPFPRQVLNIIVHGGKKSLKEYCDATKGRAEILKHLECVTPETSKIFYNSLEHGFRRIDYISANVHDDDLLSTLCCTFHLIYNQTIDLVRHHCSKSPDSTVRLIRTIVDNIAKDVLDLGCGKWPSLDSCDSQIPQIMEKLRSINPPEKTELAKRFLIGPVVSIASRLVA
ncbi:uncharacterized protein LOC107366250 [Tetranychus urticae]|uniref:Uncharacterized protein n=1 Tax=Tetranychus urticae TaxID=32264 RepID=T1KQ03_TETUR|nr:uncharacterized protein LOC107366250 [Tetranychus urticae]